ncbi:MAG: ABC transporter substrate-binding protein [Ilumatobacteraceae bacterium]
MHNRRQFMTTSARLLGGALVLGPALIACGSDEKSESTTAPTTAGTATTAGPATTVAGGSAPSTGASGATGATAPSAGGGSVPSLGTVRTQFNWVPDVEWAAWYLADTNCAFAANGAGVSLIHGGPNTPAVAQVLAAGAADLGVASDELQLIKANQEGSDYVLLGAMYPKSPFGYCWLADTPITTAKDLVGKKIGGVQGDQLRIDAVFKVNGLAVDYEFVPMSYDPQPLIDKDVDVITAYVTNQPVQLQLKNVATKSAPFSDFGLKSYGDLLFASKKYVDANRDLLVGYLKGLLAGVKANTADPAAVLPLLTDTYGKDADIDLAYSAPGNKAYVALYATDPTKLLAIDPAYLEAEVWKGYTAAGETNLPKVADFVDVTLLADALKG